MRALIMVMMFVAYLAATPLTFLDSKTLPVKHINGLKFTEISDIAYDKQNDIFYALSDRGRIFRFKLEIRADKLGKFKLLDGERLRDQKGHFLRKRRSDSEGLALVGNKIWISFERRDRIDVYDRSYHFVRSLRLPPVLAKMASHDYSGTGFEALSYAPKWGFITAREVPFDEEPLGYHTIFSSKGIICRIKRDKIKSAITEFEMLPDGSLLALFRQFSFKKWAFRITLKRIDINHPRNGICSTETLAMLNPLTDKDVDNFEGLTHYKGDLYLMISDDNENFFQRTIVRLMRIKE